MYWTSASCGSPSPASNRGAAPVVQSGRPDAAGGEASRGSSRRGAGRCRRRLVVVGALAARAARCCSPATAAPEHWRTRARAETSCAGMPAERVACNPDGGRLQQQRRKPGHQMRCAHRRKASHADLALELRDGVQEEFTHVAREVLRAVDLADLAATFEELADGEVGRLAYELLPEWAP
eukprot:16435127-Heterocapsa_arctica.AAC.1